MVMLIQMRENDNIKGISIGDFDIRLSTFADDTYFLTLGISHTRYLFRVWGLLIIKTFTSARDVGLGLQKVN